MKHNAKILTAFISLFLLAQVLGIFLLSLNIQEVVKTSTGTSVIYGNTSIGERPEVEGYSTLIYIGIGVGIGTILLLILARFNKTKIWKIWFLLASWMTMSISIGVMFGGKTSWIPLLIAAGLAVLKVKWTHPAIHNITELLTYAGIAVLLSPILSVGISIILLLLISVYDAYAVWKSKHMIKLAEFTKKSNLFPGLALTYTKDGIENTINSGNSSKSRKELSEKEQHSAKENRKKTKTGILGGGDVVFPLLFTGAVFTKLVETGQTGAQAMGYSIIISIGAAIALTLLFVYGKKDRFYPAMPFITAGCLFGYLVLKLVLLA